MDAYFPTGYFPAGMFPPGYFPIATGSARAVPTVLESEWEDLEPDPDWALWEDA